MWRTILDVARNLSVWFDDWMTGASEVDRSKDWAKYNRCPIKYNLTSTGEWKILPGPHFED